MFAVAKPYTETHTVWPFLVPVCLAVLTVSPVGRRRQGATRRDRGSHLLFVPFLGAGIVVLIRSRTFASDALIQPPAVAFFLGEVILVGGMILRFWAIRSLGSYFTTSVQTSDDQPVITAGPYRLLRHPSYTGLLMTALGAGLIIGNWAGLAAITGCTLVPLVYRIHVEEQALRDALGELYTSFARTRKRLIPGVW